MLVRLILFGSPTIAYDGETLALPFERRNQPLAFLALKRSWVGRAELAAMLWPEQEDKLTGHAASQYRVLFDLLQGLARRPRPQWTEKDCRNTMRTHTPNRTGSSW